MGALPPQEEQKLTIVSFWKPFWRTLHPKTREIQKSAKFHDFRDFHEIARILQKITFSAEMSPWRRDAPPEPPQKVYRGKLLSVASGGGAVCVKKVEKVRKQENFMKSRNFHEIPGFPGNSVKSHDAAGGEKRKRGAPRGPPVEVGPVRIMST